MIKVYLMKIIKFKNEKQMPILEDLYNILGQDEKTKNLKQN